MRKNLTAQFIKGLKESSTRQVFVDTATPNLNFVVQPTGKKVWSWSGKYAGRTRSTALGLYPQYDLNAAREWASEINEARSRGEPFPADVVVEEVPAEPVVDPRAHMNCDWLFDRYMEGEGGKKKSADQKRKMYDREIKNAVGHKHIDTITHDDLAAIIQRKFDEGYPVASNRIKALISRWWRWSVTRGRTTSGLTNDPARDLVCLADETGRDRYLSNYEIGVFFQALPEVEESFAETLTVILYTGMRRAEAFGLQWKEIDWEKNAIDIPKERIKNGLPLVLGLPETVLGIINARRLRTGTYAYVWPATRSFSVPDEDEEEFEDTTKAVTGWGKPMAALNEACRRIAAKDKKTIERFTIHDLRRTLSSGMNGLMGEDNKPLIASDIVERVINHRIGGVKGVYNRYGYFAEKAAALAVWADHLDPIRLAALEAIQKTQSEANADPTHQQAAA